MIIFMTPCIEITNEESDRRLSAFRLSPNCVLVMCSERGHMLTLFGKVSNENVTRLMEMM